MRERVGEKRSGNAILIKKIHREMTFLGFVLKKWSTQNLSWPGNSLKPILRDGLLSGSSVGDYQPSYCSVHKMQKNNTYPKK
jgi:hypothetical protein